MATNSASISSPNKRSRSDLEAAETKPKKRDDASAADESIKISIAISPKLTYDTDTSSDDDFGPALPSSAPKKKRRKLPYEKVYISALPTSTRYSKSLMHKDQLSFVTVTPFTDFLVTSSVDGVVKFWKKVAVGVESVKEFKAHVGEIKSVSVSQDGRSFATAGIDKTIKVFDIITFGKVLTSMLLSLLADSDGKICWRFFR